LVVVDVVVITITLGWFLSISWRAIRMKEWERLPIGAAGFGAMAGTTWTWWLNMQDLRPLYFVGLLAAFVMAKIKPPGILAKKGYVPSVLAGGVIFTYGSFTLLSQLPPFGMFWRNQESASWPGARYSASVVNVDGIAYGYDILVLRPARLELSTLLDRPHRDVAEFVMEGDVTELKWTSPTLLTVTIRPKTEFVTQRRSWNGVTINYVVDDEATLSDSAE